MILVKTFTLRILLAGCLILSPHIIFGNSNEAHLLDIGGKYNFITNDYTAEIGLHLSTGVKCRMGYTFALDRDASTYAKEAPQRDAVARVIGQLWGKAMIDYHPFHNGYMIGAGIQAGSNTLGNKGTMIIPTIAAGYDGTIVSDGFAFAWEVGIGILTEEMLGLTNIAFVHSANTTASDWIKALFPKNGTTMFYSIHANIGLHYRF